MTNKKKTYMVLEAYFLNDEIGRINEAYLNECIILEFNNTERLANNKTRTPKSLVWEAFQIITNRLLKENVVSVYNFVCSSQQLKDFLNDYGNGYDSLKESLEYVAEHRKEQKM